MIDLSWVAVLLWLFWTITIKGAAAFLFKCSVYFYNLPTNLLASSYQQLADRKAPTSLQAVVELKNKVFVMIN